MKLIDYKNTNSLAYHFRKRRMQWFAKLVEKVIYRHSLKGISICDVGGTASYWRIFPFQDFQDIRFNLSLINLEYPEYDEDIQYPANASVTRLIGDACDLKEIADFQFDIAHSNSVIEHIGTADHRERMAKEIRRIGKYYYVQSPCFWFPIEPHFLIPFYTLLPRPARLWVLQKTGKSGDLRTAVWRDDSVCLLTKAR